MKKLLLFIAAAILILSGVGQALAATTADVIFVVDESGSMSGEHTWLGGMIGALDSNLAANGVTGNRYGLVGFGGGSAHTGPHTHAVGGGDWGSATDFATATGTLLINGGLEDGWAGIDYALNNYGFRSNAAVNIVLVTDEDRDNWNSNGLSYAGMLATLNSKKAVLNSVVNANFADGALGTDGTDSYLADGSGGYTTSSGWGVTSDWGTTKEDYIDLALATSGAGWSLNRLRDGGNTAVSFTNAFVDIKTEEIIIAPEPSFALLLGPALLGLVAIRRKIRK